MGGIQFDRMNERSREHEVETPEQEAAAKIRNFVDDPLVKIHFSKMTSLEPILKQGILSQAFAERIGQPIKQAFEEKYTAAHEVSVVTRNDQDHPKVRPSERDHWFRQFNPFETIGFLLARDLPLKPRVGFYKQPTGEETADFRIKPSKIEGLIVIDHLWLMRPLETSPLSYYLQNLFGIKFSELCERFPEYAELLERLPILRPSFASDEERLTWMESRNREENRILAPLAEELLGKSISEATTTDLFILYAKKAKLPLYKINHECTQQEVLWPKVLT